MADRTNDGTSKRYFFVFLTILLLVVGALTAGALGTLDVPDSTANGSFAALPEEVPESGSKNVLKENGSPRKADG